MKENLSQLTDIYSKKKPVKAGGPYGSKLMREEEDMMLPELRSGQHTSNQSPQGNGPYNTRSSSTLPKYNNYRAFRNNVGGQGSRNEGPRPNGVTTGLYVASKASLEKEDDNDPKGSPKRLNYNPNKF